MNIRIIIISLITILCIQASAQNNSFCVGLEVGGNFNSKSYTIPSYQSDRSVGTKTSNYKNYTTLIGSNLHVFINENLLVGINFNWSENNDPSEISISKSNYFTYSLSTRIYPIKRIYIQGQWDFGVAKNEITPYNPYIPTSSGYSSLQNTETAKGHSTGYTLSGGYSFKLSHNFLLDLGLNYNYKKTKTEGNEAYDTFSEYNITSHLLYASVGLKYNFKRKEEKGTNKVSP